MPEPDENGRVPGVDYSDQSWAIAGLPPVKDRDEAFQIIAEIESPTPEEPPA
jgi:hypothetical protein